MQNILLHKQFFDIYNKVLIAPLETERYCIDIVDNMLYHCLKIVLPKSGENNRLINQRGLFTFTKHAEPLDSLVKSRFHDSTKKVLLKIKISSELKSFVLEQLNSMNINHSTLFPDINGAAIFCNHNLSLHSKTKKEKNIIQKKPPFHLRNLLFLSKYISMYIELSNDAQNSTHYFPHIDKEWECNSSELQGITNGEYIYALYQIYHHLLSHNPFTNFSTFHSQIFYSLLDDLKDIFLDNLYDGLLTEKDRTEFLDFYCTITGTSSLRYTFDENDEIVYIPIADIKSISDKEWEEAWDSLLDDCLSNLLDDSFTFYPHFTHLSEQPHFPTLTEYREAYEWLRGLDSLDYSKVDYGTNPYLFSNL